MLDLFQKVRCWMLKKTKPAKPPEKSNGKTDRREFRKFTNLIRKGKATSTVIVILPQPDGKLKVISIDRKKRMVCGGYI